MVITPEASTSLFVLTPCPRLLELDEDADGPALRARLGARTGRTSVPSVWIGAEYVGGLNDGPGLVPLDADGKLEPKLRAVGAL